VRLSAHEIGVPEQDSFTAVVRRIGDLKSTALFYALDDKLLCGVVYMGETTEDGGWPKEGLPEFYRRSTIGGRPFSINAV
jgi:hypothetical protein